MSTARNIGRTIGALMLIQGIVSPVMNFVLLSPATAPPGFLVNAAPHALQMQLAALLSVVSGALWIAMAVTALPLFKHYSQRLALSFVALAVVSLCGLIAEGIAVRSLLAVSIEHAKGVTDPALFVPVTALVRSLRNSAHYTNLLIGGGSLLVLYSVLFRFWLVPRVLSLLGFAAVPIMMSGALIPLFGQPTVMLMFMPMGVSHFALALWLVFKGFEERQPRAPAGALAAGAT